MKESVEKFLKDHIIGNNDDVLVNNIDSLCEAIVAFDYTIELLDSIYKSPYVSLNVVQKIKSNIKERFM